MQYRIMPKTGEKVSALGFGCMRLPVIDNKQDQIDEEKAIPLVRCAIDGGINYIDTAYPYHGTGMEKGGMSELFVAKVLKDGYREKVAIATKLPTWLITCREDMDRYLNEQLERLETDRIDYYLLHALNADNWANLQQHAVQKFLDAAIADGRIKYAGFSYHGKNPEIFKEIVDAYDWTFCQIQYNYMDENYQAGREGLEYAAAKKLGVVIMEPLKGGSLALNLPEAIEETYKKSGYDRSPVDWALRWLWNHEEVTILLSGMNEQAHLDENMAIASDALPGGMKDDENAVMVKVKTILKEKVKVGCTACGYCMPCPVGVDIPRNFSLLNDFHRLDSEAHKASSKRMYSMLVKEEEKASSCIECGKCESHCPQDIPIRDMLKVVTADLVG